MVDQTVEGSFLVPYTTNSVRSKPNLYHCTSDGDASKDGDLVFLEESFSVTCSSALATGSVLRACGIQRACGIRVRVHARRDKVGVRCAGVCRREELNVRRAGIVCALNKVPIVEKKV